MTAPDVILMEKPRFRKKIAAFDFDWTLVCPKNGGVFPTPNDIHDWDWRFPTVTSTIRDLYKKGYGIYVFTNQSKEFKMRQIHDAMKSLGIPLTVVAARDKEDYKPKRLIWDLVIPEKKEWDKNKSFFVGDAAGRPEDWAPADKEFADNIGIKFMLPEDVFGARLPNILYKLAPQETVIMVGYPGSGKSTFAATHFQHPDYEIINGDLLKTPQKMIKAAEQAFALGKSVVFDATNPSVERRKEFITWAQSHQMPVKCVHVSTDMDRAFFHNQKRAEPIPKIAYYMYRKKFQKPHADEGCEVFVV
jgi:bifunctional polynucleotide phosphatase/kinase